MSNFSVINGKVFYSGKKRVEIKMKLNKSDSAPWVVILESGQEISAPPCDIHSMAIREVE